MNSQSGPIGLTVDCARLRADPLDRLKVRRRWVIDDAALSAARVVDGEVLVDMTIEAMGVGFVAEGRVEGIWVAECRRCLGDVRGSLCATLREVFEDRPVEGETWPVVFAWIDLAPLVREAALLALPLAPLCASDCAGPDPGRFPTGPALSRSAASQQVAAVEPVEPPIDPRWAALSEIRFDV